MQPRTGKWLRPVAKVVLPILLMWCLAPASRGQADNKAGAKVEGAVFVLGAAGQQSFVVGATVKLSGPINVAAETDEEGRYVVADVPAGTYTVEAAAPGLKAVQT